MSLTWNESGNGQELDLHNPEHRGTTEQRVQLKEMIDGTEHPECLLPGMSQEMDKNLICTTQSTEVQLSNVYD